MSNKISQIFDYEKFSKNDKIESMIGDIDARYGRKLSEDELDQVAAAGIVDDVKKLLGIGKTAAGLRFDQIGGTNQLGIGQMQNNDQTIC